MRLLQIEADGAFSLGEYVGRDIPRYAILSHRWGADHEEVTLRDFVEGTGKSKAGYCKLTFCGKQAANDGLRFFWIDTCCIDKASSAEVSEAINSMFHWYQVAAKCYVYLSDVSTRDFARNEQSFQRSSWFKRGWTLQELVAPICVEFFSSDGDQIGDKSSMVQEIHSITSIPIQALQGSPLAHFSVDERMSWTESRETKREEDAAYCLLGIFDIHMPLLYGEGRKNAFSRLQRVLKESSEDDLHALSSLALCTEKPKHKGGPFSTVPSDEDSDFVQRSDIPGLLSAYMDVMENADAYKDKVSFQIPIRDESSGASRRRGKPDHKVEMFQNATNTLSNFVLPTNRASHTLEQSTELEDYITSRITFLHYIMSMAYVYIQMSKSRIGSDIQASRRFSSCSLTSSVGRG
jgi:hypothetical protein